MNASKTLPNTEFDYSEDKFNESYYPCFFEVNYYKKLKKIPDIKLYFLIATVFYFFIVAVFLILYKNFGVNDKGNYIISAWIVGAAIFWPAIVILNSTLLYKINEEMYPMYNNMGKKWYSEKGCLAFSVKPFRMTSVSFVLSLTILVAVLYICYNCGSILNKNIVFHTAIFVSLVNIFDLVFCEKNKNFLTISFVVNLGLLYYIYVAHISGIKFELPFDKGNILLNTYFICTIISFFAVMGSTVYPMIKLIKSFYCESFEDCFEYPIKNIPIAISKIKNIQYFFGFLTVINIFVFIQLLISAIFIGVFDKDISSVTGLIFLVGSFFPLAMYFGTTLLYQQFVEKIALKHIQALNCEGMTELDKTTLYQSIISMFRSGSAINTDFFSLIITAVPPCLTILSYFI